MFNFSCSELLFYGGLTIMIISVIAAVLFIILLKLIGQKLKRVLEKEYGKLPY